MKDNLSMPFFIFFALEKLNSFRLFHLTGDENIIHIQSDSELIAEAAIFDDERYPANSAPLKKVF